MSARQPRHELPEYVGMLRRKTPQAKAPRAEAPTAPPPAGPCASAGEDEAGDATASTPQLRATPAAKVTSTSEDLVTAADVDAVLSRRKVWPGRTVRGRSL